MVVGEAHARVELARRVRGRASRRRAECLQWRVERPESALPPERALVRPESSWYDRIRLCATGVGFAARAGFGATGVGFVRR